MKRKGQLYEKKKIFLFFSLILLTVICLTGSMELTQAAAMSSVSGGAIQFPDLSEEDEHQHEYNIISSGDYLPLMTPGKALQTEAQTYGAHVHTDACYDGHRHVDPLSGVNMSNAPVRIQFENGKSYRYNDIVYHSDMRVSIKCGQCYNDIYIFSVYRATTTQVDVYTVNNGVFSIMRVTHGGVDGNGQPNFYASNIYRQFQSYLSIVASDPDLSRDEYATVYTGGVFNFNLAGLPKWDSNANISYIPFTGCSRARSYGHTMNENACYPVGYKGKVNLTGITYYSDNTEKLNLGVTCSTCKNEILNINMSLYSAGGSSSGLTGVNVYTTFSVRNSSGAIEKAAVGSSFSAHLGSSDRSWDLLRIFSSSLFPAYYRLRSQLAPYTTFNDYGNGFINATSVDSPLTGIPIKCGQYANSPVLFLPNMGCAYCGGTFGSNYSCGQAADEIYECDKVVTGISPLYPNQTIYSGSPMDVRVNATYLDGHTAVINGTTSFNTNNIGNNQTATLSYSGLINTAKTSGTLSCAATINVIPNLSSITVVPSATTVYNGTVPTYTVTAIYADGRNKTLASGEYSMSGWSAGYGTKTVTFYYTDGGKTVQNSITITVKPNLTGLTATASNTTPYHGEAITFTVKASYENGNNTTVTAVCTNAYNSNLIGNQTVSYDYTENGITKSASVALTVQDYPVSLKIDLVQPWIYQGQNITLRSSTVDLASGAVEPVSPTIAEYDNVTLGNKNISFSYTLNSRSVSVNKTVEIRPDLYDLILSASEVIIYRGQDPTLTVTAKFNVGGNVVLDSKDYVISGFDNDVYDRNGKIYPLVYTDKGVTIYKEVKIKILPNIEAVAVSAAAQATEGVPVPFTAEITYEDGVKRTLTEADVDDPGSGLSVGNYDLNEVGYQDIDIIYTEGGKTISHSVRIRVRALIKVSIPISALVSIDPNKGLAYSPILVIDNQSKESVIVGISSVQKGPSDLDDVMPNKYPDWGKLGKRDSKNIAIGFDYASENWMEEFRADPLYLIEAYQAELGTINKETISSLKFQIQHGNSFESNIAFNYVIHWVIRLAEE